MRLSRILHDYSDAELEPWLAWAREVDGQGVDGYFFFNNDGQGRAPKNAQRFIQLLGGAASAWSGTGPGPLSP